MKTTSIDDFLAKVARRKAEIGFDDSPEATEARRNKGARRTARKIALLRIASDSAMAAGVKPVISYVD